MQSNEYRPLSLGDWLFTLIIVAIPLLGFIMLLVWAFSSSTHPSKKTFAQASLILAVVSMILAAVAVFGLAILGAGQVG